LNVPFQEPLYELIDCEELPSFQFETKENSMDVLKEVNGSLEIIQQAERIMVLVGQHVYEDFSKKLEQFNLLQQVVVLTETHANVNIENAFPCIDRMIMGLDGNAQQTLAPDVLITVGTNIISRKIKAILRKSKPKHIQVGFNEKKMDTFDCLELQCNLTPQDFFNSLKEIESKSEWKNELLSIQENQIKQVEAWLPDALFSDLTVFSSLLKFIPSGPTCGGKSPAPAQAVYLAAINRFMNSKGFLSGFFPYYFGCTACWSHQDKILFNITEVIY
jgi:2-succinyl-5-enolpyruvyl-6-hydroxy-3-cyclohexene-1-carboxylate synthase